MMGQRRSGKSNRWMHSSNIFENMNEVGITIYERNRSVRQSQIQAIDFSHAADHEYADHY